MPNISQKLEKLLVDRELVDIVLVVQDSIYETHKLVLMANSPVFKTMFSDVRWANVNKESVLLNEDSSCIPFFPLFIRYMYTNQIIFTLNNVLPILILADKYQVMDLLNMCLEYMDENISRSIESGEILYWYQFCAASSQTNIRCLEDFICWNFSAILKTEYFIQLPSHMVKYFLSRSDLVTLNELEIKDALSHWYSYNNIKITKKEGDLSYSYLRTPYFPLSLLVDIFNNSCGHDDLNYNLTVATKFHTFNLKERAMVKWNNAERLLTSPRIYISELWSTTFVIPNFSKFPSYGVRTEIFSTLSSCSRADSKMFWEWTLDFYPKGIEYDKSLFISTNKTYELPGVVIKSVQARLTATGNIYSHPRKVDVYFLFHSSSSSPSPSTPNSSSPLETKSLDSCSPEDFDNMDALSKMDPSLRLELDQGYEYIKTVVKRTNCHFNYNKANNGSSSYYASQAKRHGSPQSVMLHDHDYRNYQPAFHSSHNTYRGTMIHHNSYYHDHRYHCNLPPLDDDNGGDSDDANNGARHQQTSIKFEDLVPFTKLSPSHLCQKHFGKYWQTFLKRDEHLLLGSVDALKVTVVIIPCP